MNKLKNFLNNHNISASAVDMTKMVNFMLSEMEKGLLKKPSSLEMINSYCSPVTDFNTNEKVIVIDAGGTNLRTCTVHFEDNMKAVVEDFKKTKMPGIDREVSKKEFFSILADETQRLIDKTDKIGFCFSYAAEILPDHDGFPTSFSKEIKAPEVIGQRLGKGLLDEFKTRGIDVSKKKVIILNDTVTTLLAGLSETKKLGCEGCIGFILGTGTNTAYVEKGTIINTESGNLDVILGDIDKKFISSTEIPSIHHLEKVISGAYLGPGCLFVIRQAAEEGLFTKDFVVPESLSTIEMSNYLEKRETNLITKNADDEMVLSTIIKAYIERTAKLTASCLSACVIKADAGKDKPILINADGSTFYKTIYLADFIYKYTKDCLSSYGRKAVFTQIENSPTLGSAIGALSL